MLNANARFTMAALALAVGLFSAKSTAFEHSLSFLLLLAAVVIALAQQTLP